MNQYSSSRNNRFDLSAKQHQQQHQHYQEAPTTTRKKSRVKITAFNDSEEEIELRGSPLNEKNVYLRENDKYVEKQLKEAREMDKSLPGINHETLRSMMTYHKIDSIIKLFSENMGILTKATILYAFYQPEFFLNAGEFNLDDKTFKYHQLAEARNVYFIYEGSPTNFKAYCFLTDDDVKKLNPFGLYKKISFLKLWDFIALTPKRKISRDAVIDYTHIKKRSKNVFNQILKPGIDLDFGCDASDEVEQDENDENKCIKVEIDEQEEVKKYQQSFLEAMKELTLINSSLNENDNRLALAKAATENEEKGLVIYEEPLPYISQYLASKEEETEELRRENESLRALYLQEQENHKSTYYYYEQREQANSVYFEQQQQHILQLQQQQQFYPPLLYDQQMMMDNNQFTEMMREVITPMDHQPMPHLMIEGVTEGGQQIFYGEEHQEPLNDHLCIDDHLFRMKEVPLVPLMIMTKEEEEETEMEEEIPIIIVATEKEKKTKKKGKRSPSSKRSHSKKDSTTASSPRSRKSKKGKKKDINEEGREGVEEEPKQEEEEEEEESVTDKMANQMIVPYHKYIQHVVDSRGSSLRKGFVNLFIPYKYNFNILTCFEHIFSKISEETNRGLLEHEFDFVNNEANHYLTMNYKIELLANIPARSCMIIGEDLQRESAMNMDSIENKLNISNLYLHYWFLLKAINIMRVKIANAGNDAKDDKYRIFRQKKQVREYSPDILKKWYPRFTSGRNTILTPDLRIYSLNTGPCKPGTNKGCPFCKVTFEEDIGGLKTNSHHLGKCDYIANYSNNEKDILEIILKESANPIFAAQECVKQPYKEGEKGSLLREATETEIFNNLFLIHPNHKDSEGLPLKVRINTQKLLAMRERAWKNFTDILKSLDNNKVRELGSDPGKRLGFELIDNLLDPFKLTQPVGHITNANNSGKGKNAKVPNKRKGFLERILLDHEGNNYAESLAKKLPRQFVSSKSVYADDLYYANTTQDVNQQKQQQQQLQMYQQPMNNTPPFNTTPPAFQFNGFTFGEPQQQHQQHANHFTMFYGDGSQIDENFQPSTPLNEMNLYDAHGQIKHDEDQNTQWKMY